jgi:hypothetical protein
MIPNKMSWKEKHFVQEEGKITDNMDADENSETAKDILAGIMMLKGRNDCARQLKILMRWRSLDRDSDRMRRLILVVLSS